MADFAISVTFLGAVINDEIAALGKLYYFETYIAYTSDGYMLSITYVPQHFTSQLNVVNMIKDLDRFVAAGIIGYNIEPKV